MDEQIEQQAEPVDEEQVFIVRPRRPARLVFEEWDGRVERGNSRVLTPVPPCPICNAYQTPCRH